MTDVWIHNSTGQGREVRATLAQRAVFLRSGEQMRVTGDPDGIAELVDHMRQFGAVQLGEGQEAPPGLITLHPAELREVPIAGTLQVEKPADPDDPQRLSLAVPKKSGAPADDGVER